MVGHDDDLLLRLNGENCPKFGQALEDNKEHLDKLTKKFEKHFFPRLAHLIGKENITREEALDLCEYVHWADLHEVELNVTLTREDVHHCHGLLIAVDKYISHVDKKLNQIATNYFRTYLHDHIKSVAEDLDYNLTLHYKDYAAKDQDNVSPS